MLLLFLPPLVMAVCFGPVATGFHRAPTATAVAARIHKEIAAATIIGALANARQFSGDHQLPRRAGDRAQSKKKTDGQARNLAPPSRFVGEVPKSDGVAI